LPLKFNPHRRISVCNDLIFFAGTKDSSDLYSQADGNEDWELLKYYTEEVIPNTEEKAKKSWENLSKYMKT
jgi:hypothetical protein